MAENNARSIWDVANSQNRFISRSHSDTEEEKHTNAPEERDLERQLHIINEGGSPSIKESSCTTTVQVSAVPDSSNLFELLIQRVGYTNNSKEPHEPPSAADKAKHLCTDVMEVTTSTPDINSSNGTGEQETVDPDTQATDSTLRPSTSNEMGSANGDGESTRHEQACSGANDIDSVKKTVPAPRERRSLFEHLRKSFRRSQSDERAHGELSIAIDDISTGKDDGDVSSSCDREVSGDEYVTPTSSKIENSSKPTSTTKDPDRDSLGVTKADESTSPVAHDTSTTTRLDVITVEGMIPTPPSQRCSTPHAQQTTRDSANFPFTERLKWISKLSRNGKPTTTSPKHKEPLQRDSNTEGFRDITSLGPTTSSGTQFSVRLINGEPTKVMRANVVTMAAPPASNSNSNGVFQPLSRADTDSSFLGAVTLRLGNKATEMNGKQTRDPGKDPDLVPVVDRNSHTVIPYKQVSETDQSHIPVIGPISKSRVPENVVRIAEGDRNRVTVLDSSDVTNVYVHKTDHDLISRRAVERGIVNTNPNGDLPIINRLVEINRNRISNTNQCSGESNVTRGAAVHRNLVPNVIPEISQNRVAEQIKPIPCSTYLSSPRIATQSSSSIAGSVRGMIVGPPSTVKSECGVNTYLTVVPSSYRELKPKLPMWDSGSVAVTVPGGGRAFFAPVPSINSPHRIVSPGVVKVRSIFDSPGYPADLRGKPVPFHPSTILHYHSADSGFRIVPQQRPFEAVYASSQSFPIICSNRNQFSKTNSDLSCLERLVPSPEISSHERMFRPVTPSRGNAVTFQTQTHTATKTDEMDRDDCAYAYALNESANSPDIERILASESPSAEVNRQSNSTRSSDNKPESTDVIMASKSKGSVMSFSSPSSHAITSSADFCPSLCTSSWGSARTSSTFVFTSAGLVSTSSGLIPSKADVGSVVSKRNGQIDVDNTKDTRTGSPVRKVSDSEMQDDDVFEIHPDAENTNEKESDSESSQELMRKRKSSSNIIQKRLEPKLPSPVREPISSDGDLYRDPSELTREERALQRAMMRFSEMELQEKEKATPVEPVVQKVRKRVRKKLHKDDASQAPATRKQREHSATSTWLQKVRKKQRLWISQRAKIAKKTSGSVSSGIKRTVDEDDITISCQVQETQEKSQQTTSVEPATTCTSTEAGPKEPTKIKKRKKLDKINDENKPRKKKKFKKNVIKTDLEEENKKGEEEFKTEKEVPNAEAEANAETETKKRKKKEKKKLMMKKKLGGEVDDEQTAKRPNMEVSTENNRSSDEIVAEVPAEDIKSSETKAAVDRSHRIKTYMLVASYQGFKDFQPTVIQSRTRRKGQQVSEPATPENAKLRKDFPLLVVESVRSKPVKEMVVAENEEVQQLVTNCLRMRGKWRGDELELALKREEAELDEEVNRFRDARKLTVNRTTGETILHKAARLGYDEVVKQCILQGADPNAKDNAGWTPLHEACARGKLAVVKVLTRYGAAVNAHSNDGIRPLHDAAEGGHVDVIRVLLSYGADPMLATYAGNTAYACAKEMNTKKLLKDYILDIGRGDPEDCQDITDGWEFAGSCSFLDDHSRPERMTGIWEEMPECVEVGEPEFEVSETPHLPTYNLPVFKNGAVVGRRNYLLLPDLYEKSNVAKTTIQKRLKSVELREMHWTEFLETISQNQLYITPTFTPEGSSTEEPKAQLVPLNYTIRRLLNIRIEPCR